MPSGESNTKGKGENRFSIAVALPGLIADAMNLRSQRLSNKLATAPKPVFIAYAIAAAFATYFCMYAFRKPFAAARFDGELFLGGEVPLKTAFVVSQILGYTASKYLGIKVCPEVPSGRRALMLVVLILAAEAALVLFALVPRDLKVVAIFCNGLPLGMVWGLVVWHLEGRLTSELLLAGLACSYIVSSGTVKDVGRYLMAAHGVSEAAMPMLTGLLFLPPFLLSVWLLGHLPPPTAADRAARVERTTMDRSSRLAFLRALLVGLVLLFAVRLLTTAFRDYRDNYGVELFEALGYHGDPALFTRTEVPVALGVMAALALLNLVRSSRAGVAGAHALMATGFALMALSTLLLDVGVLSGIGWMILVGLGSYMAYVPLDSVVFDRIIASTRVAGTAVFAIYLADAIGYTGSIGLPLVKDLLFPRIDRLAFFRAFTYVVSLGGTGLLVASGVYFYRRHKHPPEDVMADEDPVEFVLRLFKERGGAAYIGEPVSQTEHALQTAWAAEQAGAGGALVAAALLHDVGHLLHELPEDCALAGIDDAHEVRGARWLVRHFGPEVAEPVRLHVAAKRFLCATDPSYAGRLSEASLRSLQLQGGPFTPDEAAGFRVHPYAEAALMLRRLDEQAKVPGRYTPDLEHFRPALEAARAARRDQDSPGDL
jgi:phosphonate degradation associated HDIG domain protein